MRAACHLTSIGLCAVPVLLSAQAIDTVLLNEQSFTHHAFVYSTYASVIDRMGRPYLYTANMEYGLRIYDIADPSAPTEVFAQWPPFFAGSKPTNLLQQDELLFVPLGGFHGVTQNAGLAILSVNDPAAPLLLDQWDSTAFSTGSAIVRVKDGFAYLGAMESGIIILDVSDPTDITFVSSFLPDTLWPGIVSYPPNARGMALHGDTLFLCFDAGCVRAIDVSDKYAPVEIGHYVNPQQPPNTAVAYNNATLAGDVLFVTTDFCGFEAVDVSDPANMQQLTWVNPWNCNGLSWFGSDGHTNELITTLNDSLLFISGADSELLIYDITSPASPQLVGGIIHPNDSSVVWGLDVKDSLVVLNYINNSTVIFPPQPYYANDGGFQILTWQADLSTHAYEAAKPELALIAFPNPTNGTLTIDLPGSQGPVAITVCDAMGRPCLGMDASSLPITIDLSLLQPGSYALQVIDPAGVRIAQRLIHTR